MTFIHLPTPTAVFRSMTILAMAVACLICIPLLFCSCFEGLRAKQPLSDPRMDLVDEQLLGRWELVEPRLAPDEKLPLKTNLAIVRAEDPASKGLMRLEFDLESPGDKSKASWSVLLTSTQIGKDKFLNVFSLRPIQKEMADLTPQKGPAKKIGYRDWQASKDREINVLRYEVTRDELKIVNYSEQVRQRLTELRAKDPQVSEGEAILRIAREVDEGDQQQAIVMRYRRPEAKEEKKAVD